EAEHGRTPGPAVANDDVDAALGTGVDAGRVELPVDVEPRSWETQRPGRQPDQGASARAEDVEGLHSEQAAGDEQHEGADEERPPPTGQHRQELRPVGTLTLPRVSASTSARETPRIRASGVRANRCS